MSLAKINNVLSKKEMNIIHSVTKGLVAPKNDDGSFIYEDDTDLSVSKYLGRIQLNVSNFHDLFSYSSPENLLSKLQRIANDHSEHKLRLASVTYVEYNSEYGVPDLPPHYDGDYNDLIINYQLESNTKWSVGVNFETYALEDNSALIFNPNTEIHWRPKKTFAPGQFVKMVFFRFENEKNRSDYTELRKFWPKDEIFESIRNFRDSLVED